MLNAIHGIINSLRYERNMRIHLCFAFYVFIAAIVCKIEAWQVCATSICVAAVIGFECMNTAVENCCDSVMLEKNERIKLAKDAAAGATLVCAIGAVIVGVTIFFSAESLQNTKLFIEKYPILAVVIVLTLPFWIKYIFMRRPNKCQK